MARALRINYKGALYHITSRGNERRNIFENDYDRYFFIKTLKKSLNIYNVVTTQKVPKVPIFQK